MKVSDVSGHEESSLRRTTEANIFTLHPPPGELVYLAKCLPHYSLNRGKRVPGLI
jgi:hypothetical protein